MNLREAAQQALEALERYSGVDQRACDAEEALLTALAEPEQKPVAYVSGVYAGHFTVVPTNPALVLTTGMALYTHPPQRKPLTDEEIGKIILETEITLKNYCDVDLQTDFARRIERAHGIGR